MNTLLKGEGHESTFQCSYAIKGMADLLHPDNLQGRQDGDVSGAVSFRSAGAIQTGITR